MPAAVADFKLEVRSHPRLLRPVRWLVRTWLNEMGVGGDRADEVVLALDEACSNTLRHSYHGADGHTLTLSLRSDPQWLEFELCDAGEPAPPDKVRQRLQEEPVAERLQAGGLGVQLIYRVFDEVKYLPVEPQGNKVTMRLRRRPA